MRTTCNASENDVMALMASAALHPSLCPTNTEPNEPLPKKSPVLYNSAESNKSLSPRRNSKEGQPCQTNKHEV